MKIYVVNDNNTTNPGMHHEVHTLTHATELNIRSYTTLGLFVDAVPAVKKARLIYPNADGCRHCSPEACSEPIRSA